MKQLLIVAHSPSPNTAALRHAAERQARQLALENVRICSLSPFDAGPNDLRAADAVLLGTPENLGAMSGALKDFFDRSYYTILEEMQGTPYSYYIRAGQDGTGTRRGIESVATGLKWRLAAKPVLCHGTWRPSFLDDVGHLAATMAAGLEIGML